MERIKRHGRLNSCRCHAQSCRRISIHALRIERDAESGDFGAWSDWSTTAVTGSETREVESETRYRSRKLETTTSSNSSMSGWELTDTTYSWSDYGPWSSWQTASVSSSDSRKVETKTQYSCCSQVHPSEYAEFSHMAPRCCLK